jgi:hypothetical protein
MNPSSLTLEGQPALLSEGVRTAASVAANAVSACGPLFYLPDLGDRGMVLTNRQQAKADTILLDGSWSHQFARAHPWFASASTQFGVVRIDVEHAAGPHQFPPTASRTHWRGHRAIRSWRTPPAIRPGNASHQHDPVGERTRHRVRRHCSVFTSMPSSWFPRFAGAAVHAHARVRLRSTFADLEARSRHCKRTALIAPKGAGVIDGMISPDGSWIAYASNETSAWVVFVRPADG